MDPIESLYKHVSRVEDKINYVFKNKQLLVLAFIHCSYINENRTIKSHNERLEFLGDAVLGILIAEYLYRNFPEIPEGELSYLRARLVEAQSCMAYVQKLNVEGYLFLGRGESISDGRGRTTILADLFEALIGAIYLDGGMEAATRFLFGHFKEEIESIVDTPRSNWKAMLQDYCQKKFQQVPIYKVLDETGPDHGKQFCVVVYADKQQLGIGSGASKKIAQQAAAENALSKIED